jgi:hypothetical protein
MSNIALLREELVQLLESHGMQGAAESLQTGRPPSGWEPDTATFSLILGRFERDTCFDCGRNEPALRCEICHARWCDASCRENDARRHAGMCLMLVNMREIVKEVAHDGHLDT